MRRLFWVGVGVAVTVVVVRKGRQVAARYAPEAVVERAEKAAQDAGRRAETFVGAFRDEFARARERRESELTAALLADGQPDPADVRASGLRPGDLRGDRGARARHAARPDDAVDPTAQIEADEADLGYSF
ncbi:hypothetical protein [Isoptericola cucumis]|uniref:Secreted protein n=1 Tax=Isoptericola cucumis TaxID=1776856 RepID=A0ABQ2B6D8_9MICO|nr:hypothetical protein [Isoptericola cucumis]GGI07430.1 hypothetical protein GCM10007368_16130 [Isoptericola cucumis]